MTGAYWGVRGGRDASDPASRSGAYASLARQRVTGPSAVPLPAVAVAQVSPAMEMQMPCRLGDQILNYIVQQDTWVQPIEQSIDICDRKKSLKNIEYTNYNRDKDGRAGELNSPLFERM